MAVKVDKILWMLDLVAPMRSASSVTPSIGSWVVKQERIFSAFANDLTFGSWQVSKSSPPFQRSLIMHNISSCFIIKKNPENTICFPHFPHFFQGFGWILLFLSPFFPSHFQKTPRLRDRAVVLLCKRGVCSLCLSRFLIGLYGAYSLDSSRKAPRISVR